MKAPTVLHLFSGLGGGALGFKRAGFRTLGAFDVDPIACTNYERVVGEKATVADLGEMTPAELRAACPEVPDVVFGSPPCQGNSRCLATSKAQTEPYQALNALALRTLDLVIEAWAPARPKLILIENVPGIVLADRSGSLVRHMEALLRSSGYSVHQSVHDCGVLGGLAQHRRRWLMVARLESEVPALLFQPPPQRVRGIGELIEQLPVPLPGATDCGAHHVLPFHAAKTWLRLALIRPGKDWRDLPERVALSYPKAPRNGTLRVEGSFGVKGLDQPCTCVIGKGEVHNGPWQVADPRLIKGPRAGAFGVRGWATPTHTVTGAASIHNGAFAVADPREVDLVVEGPPLDLESKRRLQLVIQAADGTWHRPMTTAELMLAQDLPVFGPNGEWLELAGKDDREVRKQVGNAVPPGTAEAIARQMRLTLAATEFALGGSGGGKAWVDRADEVCAS